MFLEKITFKKNIEFESKRESQDNMFKVKTKTFFVKNYRKEYTDHKGRWVTPKEKVIEKKFVIFKKGLTVKFQPITVIVGDNGCGKTSLIKNLVYPYDKLNNLFMIENVEEYKANVVKTWVNDESRTLSFLKTPSYIIVEKDIHKNAIINNFKTHNSDIEGYLPPTQLLDMWDMKTFSNGENNLDFLYSLQNIKNALIVLDEPETSLSIRSQCRVKELIEGLSKENQIILITHSEILMGLTNSVYDFERKRYIKTNQYIQQQKVVKVN